jgi:hypothetical protein
MATINQKDLSGGIVQNLSPDVKPENSAELALNITFDMQGAVASRNGSRLLKTVSGVDNVKGMAVQQRLNGKERFLWTAEGALYYRNDVTWDNAVASAGISAGYEIDFTSFNGELYYIGIASASVKSPSVTWVRAGTEDYNVTDI